MGRRLVPLQAIPWWGLKPKRFVVRSITVGNNNVVEEDVTVPAAERWKILCVKMQNPDNVARVCYVRHYTTAALAVHIRPLIWISVPTGDLATFPNNVTGHSDLPAWCDVILDEGETLQCVWSPGGASAGGTAAAGLVVEYLVSRMPTAYP